jgi:enoyl-CoA hydratase/carnithine racemase
VETSLSDGVALVRLNRPDARNALSPEMMAELAGQLERADADEEIRCIVIAGSDEVFAAGADIRSLAERDFHEALFHPAADFWKRVAGCRTPLVAAVSGWALGGGCELALLCDLIVASETATFGQPEITLGIIPGGGGTQRLARVVGKQRAMELVLTGRHFDAKEAERLGLVNLVTKKNAKKNAKAAKQQPEGPIVFSFFSAIKSVLDKSSTVESMGCFAPEAADLVEALSTREDIVDQIPAQFTLHQHAT